MKRRTVGAGVVAATLVALVVAPAQGAQPRTGAAPEPQLISEQLVLTQLDFTGLPVSSDLVTQVIASSIPYQQVRVPTSTTGLHYLDRRGEPPVEGQAAVVMIGGQGQTKVLLGSDFAQPLPIALHAEYSRDGTVVDPATISGEGSLAVTYTVTNTVVSDAIITYKNAAGTVMSKKEKVFAPFAGSLRATVPVGVDVISAPGAVVSTGQDGGTVLTWNLLLYPPLGNYQQKMEVHLRSSNLVLPAATMQVAPVRSSQDLAVGFSRDLLDSSVTGNTSLAQGLTELNDNARAVADGAAQVSDGVAQAYAGASTLSSSMSGSLVPGSQQVASGAAQLATGQQQLATGIASSAAGAQSLSTGADQLASGLRTLASGLTTLASPSGLPASQQASQALVTAVTAIADAVGSPADPTITLPPPSPDVTLIQLSRASGRAAGGLKQASSEAAAALGGAVTDIATVGANAGSAATKAGSVYQAACVPAPTTLTPEQCATLAASVSDATSAATGAQAAATTVGTQAAKVGAVAAGLTGLVTAIEGLTTGLEQVSVGLRSGDPAHPGVQEGLEQLTAGLGQAVTAVTSLSTGANSSSAGADSLASGTTDLATGLDSASTGASGLATSGQQLATGAQAESDGTSAAAGGASSLAGALNAVATGSSSVADGSSALQADGTSAILDSVVKASKDPAFARAYLSATMARSVDAAPFDAPEGGVARVAYVSEIPAATAQSVGGGGSNTMLLLLLAGVLVAALGALAVRRIRGQAPSVD